MHAISHLMSPVLIFSVVGWTSAVVQAQDSPKPPAAANEGNSGVSPSVQPVNPSKNGQPAAPAQVAQSAYPSGSLPLELDDLAFERYFDLTLLARAWQKHDPSLMADAGLQLAEGERILFRPHKAFESSQIMELAAYLAADFEDKTTLDRLAKAANASKNERLLAVIKESTEVVKNPTADSHTIAPYIENISPWSLEVHQAIVRRVRTLRLSGDKEGLDTLDKFVDTRRDLHKSQHNHIDKLISDAKEAVSKRPSTLQTTVAKLDRLVSSLPPARR